MPLKKTFPDLGLSKPRIIWNRVLFPDPVSPVTPNIVPSFISKLMSLSVKSFSFS